MSATPPDSSTETHSHDALVIEDEPGNIEGQILIDALQELLIDQGLLVASEVTREIAKLESPGVHQGAQVVVRAWRDQIFKTRLLHDAKQSIGELGIAVGEAQIVVVENTAGVHNLITCTLCSCYPRSILGQPPSWYISKAYRARSVREPRVVLEEFGLKLGADIDVVVHDSNADMRYLVLPQPPANVELLSDTELEAQITRDHLIGVAR